MQSITRFVSRDLPARFVPRILSTKALRPNENTEHLSTVSSSRCIIACKLFQNYPKCVGSFCRYIGTDSSANQEQDELDETDSSDEEEGPHYIKLLNIPFKANMGDIKNLFADVEMMDEPRIIKLRNGMRSGTVIFKVPDSENAKLCLDKKDLQFNGRLVKVSLLKSESEANAYMGKTVILISGLPYKWSKFEINQLLHLKGPKDVKYLIVPPSVIGNACAGRAYVGYDSEETKKIASQIFHGMNFGNRNLRVTYANLVDALIDQTQSLKKLKNN